MFHMSTHPQRRQAPARPTRLHGAKILIVEDEVLIGMALQATLEDEGAEVVGPDCAVSEALEHTQSEDISAAVLDIRVGPESVEPVARALAARHVPFLFFTGQPANDSVRRAWPNAPVLSKEAGEPALIRAVEALLAA
jgi:DNA-binding response OmpR family regulator